MSKYSLGIADLNAYVTKFCNKIWAQGIQNCVYRILQNQLFHFTEHVESVW